VAAVTLRPVVTSARQRPAASGTVHTLHPGDVAVGGQGERFETLLGSCVAVILTDPRRTVGAMCHIVHAKPAASTVQPTAAFADVALDALHRLLQSRGIAPQLCDAYVYGGGNMFPDLDIDEASNVGVENARWVLEALAADGIRVVFHDLGGTVYRRLAWVVGFDVPQVTAVQV
jgi:chemotaxis protein CheD